MRKRERVPRRFASLALGCAVACVTAQAYSWHPVGPFVPAADLDFAPSEGDQLHKDCAMAIDPFTGYPHIVYVSNSNHQWVGARVFKIMYRYWNGSAWQDVTIETLPQEIDDGSPLPFEHSQYIGFGVAIALEKDPTGMFTVGGIAYRYNWDYDYTDLNEVTYAEEFMFVKYVDLVGNASNHNIAVGTVEDINAPETIGLGNALTRQVYANSISVAFYEDLSPLVVWRHNVQRLTYYGQVCFRHRDASLGWSGSSWDDEAKLFTDVVYDTSVENHRCAGVSMAMDKSAQAWTPCIVLSDVAPQIDASVSIYYETAPFDGLPESVTAFEGLDVDYYDVEPCVRVSLALDPTENWQPRVAYHGDGVCYTEKNSGVWTTPVVIRADSTNRDDDETVTLGSLDIHPDIGRRWISTCDRDYDGSGSIKAYRNDSGVWDSPLNVRSTGSYWMPFLRIEREYGMPVIMHSGLTGFGVLGHQLENPNIVVFLVDEKTGDPIKGKDLYIRDVGPPAGSWIRNHSETGNHYRWWRVVPKPTTNTVAFQVVMDTNEEAGISDDEYTILGSINAGWGECFTITYVLASGGCGTAPRRSVLFRGNPAACALLPLLPATLALVAWLLYRRRRAFVK